jgi:Leucine-rich repeat (LRR) protein
MYNGGGRDAATVLSALTRLESIRLVSAWPTESQSVDIGNLKLLSYLTELTLGGVGLSSNQIRQAATIPSLRSIVFEQLGTSGEAIAALSNLSKIEHLEFVDCEIVEAKQLIDLLQSLQSLKSVRFKNCKPMAVISEIRTTVKDARSALLFSED